MPGGDALEDLAVPVFVCLKGCGVVGREIAGGDSVYIDALGGHAAHESFEIALLDSGEHDPVNVGNPNEFTINELADIVLEVTGSSSIVERHPLPTDDPTQRKPDITRAKEILGWEPTVQLREGVERTIEYFRSVI